MRVAIWAAVSSLPQAKKVSLDDQLASGRDHAQRHGAQVVAELVVPGESRNIVLFEDACQRIEAYAQLRALIDAKAINALVYLDPSRLGRTAALVLTVAELCTRAGILLYETDNPPQSMAFAPPDYDALLVRAIKATTAQNEIRKTSDKHRKGMIGRVMAGLFPSRPNYGYVEVFGPTGELERYDIDQDKIAVVKQIISLFLDHGLGQRMIAGRLNDQDIPAPSGPLWSFSSVGFILHHAWRYAGYAELNRRNPSGRPYVRNKGTWPAVIDEETARRVQAELKSRDKSPKSISSTYRFSRMVFCGVCGSPMTVSNVKSRYVRKRDGLTQGGSRVYHRCPGGHSRIAERHIYTALADQIKWLQDEAHRKQLFSTNHTDQGADTIAEIERYQAQIERAQAGIKRADDDYYVHSRLDMERHSTIVAGANKAITAAQAAITQLRERLHELEQAATMGQRLEGIAEHGLAHLSNPDVRAANAWLHEHFKVRVTFSEVTGVEVF